MVTMIELSEKTKRLIERNRLRGIPPTPEEEIQRQEELEGEEGEGLSGWERYRESTSSHDMA